MWLRRLCSWPGDQQTKSCYRHSKVSDIVLGELIIILTQKSQVITIINVMKNLHLYKCYIKLIINKIIANISIINHSKIISVFKHYRSG